MTRETLGTAAQERPRHHHESAAGRLSLLCFPPAGGTAAMFRPWRDGLSDVATLVPLEAAGHGARRSEPLPTTFDEAFASLREPIARHAAGPVVLFGHSLGTLYAFEAARLLSRLGRPPVALIVSGRNGPSRPSEMPWCHELPEAEFVDRLASYGGIPEEIRAAPDVLALFLPLLRTDMQIAERYLRSPGEPIDRPVSVFYGVDDPLVSPAGVSAWRAETVAPTQVVRMPGGHFCLTEPGYLSRLRDTLAGLSRSLPLTRAAAAKE